MAKDTIDYDERCGDALFSKPNCRKGASYSGLFQADEYEQIAAFFESRPELTPTPLETLRDLGGEIGCGVAGLLAITEDESLRPVRDAAGLKPETSALAIITEGPEGVAPAARPVYLS